MTEPTSDEPIEIRLRNVSQLFNTLDPFPFRERDLSHEAEEYIISKAQLLPNNLPIKIAVSVEEGYDGNAAKDLGRAVSYWFTTKAQSESSALRLLLRDGRLAFLIGVVILSVCLLLAWYITQRFAAEPFARIFQESFVIIGWVVIWRPAEMFLYDWVPMVRRRNLYRRLAELIVTVERASSPGPAA